MAVARYGYSRSIFPHLLWWSVHEYPATMSPYDFALSLRLPFLGAYCGQDIWEQGIGHVIAARRGPSGKVIFADFLLDVHCLGIKDVVLTCDKPATFDRIIVTLEDRVNLSDCDASYARKLLDQGVAYAKSIGFPPSDTAIRALQLLHDADPTRCSDVFTFGKDGKPFYVSGPYDSVERRQEILATLERTCGSGMYDFTVHCGDVDPHAFE